MGELDPVFIQSIEDRPNANTIQAEGIPVIDLSPIISLNHSLNDEVNEEINMMINKIAEACEKWGFFQVINHGIPMEKLENMKRVARKFFSLPLEEKKKVGKDEENPIGYHDTELTRNVRDWKQVYDYTTNDGKTLIPVSPDDLQDAVTFTNRWPEDLPEFREVAQDYANNVQKLGYKLLELIALSLGLTAHRLDELFKDQTTSFIRLNYYPPCPSSHLALGVGLHKDPGGLTILSQDDNVEGLEVRRKCDGEWMRMKPTPGAFIINVGDVIQVLSNGKYESVEHRVIVNPDKDRLSIPFFFNPAHYVILKPLEELVNDRNAAKYKEFNWGSYLIAKAARKIRFSRSLVLKISHLKISP